jgi:putative ABC transport system permease protein
MRHFPADLAQSWRLFRREPGLALAALTALAMGIGFTTTMFSIVHGGTRALPVDRPDQIVVLSETGRSGGRDFSVHPFTFRQWQASLASYQGLAAFRSIGLNVSGAGAPDRLTVASVTPNAFALLRIAVARDPAFTPADAAPGAAPVAILSDTVWRTRFGADPSAVGGSIRLDGRPHTIVGVMPSGFGFPVRARIWTPLRVDARAAPGDGLPFEVFGRLKDGVTAERAGAELRLEMDRLALVHPAAFTDHAGRVSGFTELETPLAMQRGLRLLVLAVSLAFLVACANVANLLLARAAARSRDTALRTALGASRARLVGQQIAETTILAGAATLLGVAMAAAGLRFFAATSAGILDMFWVDFRVDVQVVAFAAGLGVLSALAAGLVPALRASSAGTSTLLKTQASAVTGLRMGRAGRALVVVQLALACGLFVLTATFAGAWSALRSVDLVFPARSILTATVGVPGATLDDPAARHRFLSALHDRLGAAPGLARTALVSALPGRGAGRNQFDLPDQPAPAVPLTTGIVSTTPGLFSLARASATRGRLLTWQDDERAAPVAVVNESFARRFSPDRDVLGRRIRIDGREFAVVGVVPDLMMQDVDDRDGSGIYLSMLQVRPYVLRTMTATPGAPLDAVPQVRAAVAAVDPDVPVLEPASLYDAIYADKQILDALAALFLAFGIGTVVLAFIGLFALVSFTVTARVREFGVRRALGATTGNIVGLVMRRGARELAWGLGIGLGLAVIISRGLAAALEHMPAAGPGAFTVIAVTVAGGAALALWMPLRRAARLSPIAALREP